MTNISNRPFPTKNVVFQNRKNVCGKPETPQLGFGVTDSYKKVIYIDAYVVYIYVYVLVYPIGIKYANYIALAIIPSWAA